MGSRTSMSPVGASRSNSHRPRTWIEPRPSARLGQGAGIASGPARLVAPMPGAVLTVHVSAGAIVEAGDPVVTLEAMKMEHVVVAPVAGRLTEMRVRPADQVTRGQELGLIEP